jgi:transcriptional regulator with XRE-family HTH domain
MDRTTARVRREEAKIHVARELSRARVAADIDQSELAESCGVPRQVPSIWESKDGSKSPLVADLHLMPTPVALALIRDAAIAHGHTIVSEQADETITVSTLAPLLKDVHEATHELAVGIADGALDAAELDRIERESMQAAERLTRLANTARKLRAQQTPLRVAFSSK